jgi:hypothetical protein
MSKPRDSAIRETTCDNAMGSTSQSRPNRLESRAPMNNNPEKLNALEKPSITILFAGVWIQWDIQISTTVESGKVEFEQ